MTVVIVGCGSAKADERTTAQILYTSTYFDLKRQYAEQIGDEWAILSAEHGILRPTDVVEPYDTTIDDLEGHALDQWARQVRTDIHMHYDGDPMVVLVGQQYLDALKDRSVFRDIPARFPFAVRSFSGIGEQMAFLKDQVETADQSDLTAFAGGESA